MKNIPRLLALLLAMPVVVYCQSGEKESFSLVILNEQHQVLPGATVKLLKDGKPAGSAMAGSQGSPVYDRTIITNRPEAE